MVSDGVVYAQRDLGATTIVDMCTLTGAQGISTGRYHAAHLTNSAEWEDLAQRAGRASADLTFPLVYCPELHFPEFASSVADMKNSVADRSNAQSSCAGLFINAHLGFDFPGVWLHVDMASPVHVVRAQYFFDLRHHLFEYFCLIAGRAGDRLRSGPAEHPVRQAQRVRPPPRAVPGP